LYGKNVQDVNYTHTYSVLGQSTEPQSHGCTWCNNLEPATSIMW